MFSAYNKDFVLYGFKEYCIEKLQLQPSSVATYAKVLEVYLEEYIIGKIDSQDYMSFFVEERLQSVDIKGNTLRATFLNLLEFLYNENFISGETNYLKFKNIIETNFKKDISKTIKQNTEFFTPNEIRNIFSDRIVYKSLEESKLSPLVIALAFFCLYRQNHILQLKVQDVNMENRTIRNVRYTEGSGLVEYIFMNDKFFEIMASYLAYRDSLNLDFDNLVVYRNKPISNNGLNAAFQPFKRNEIKDLINLKPIHCEILMRSRIFYIIESTDGKGISDIFLMQNSNEFYKNAFDNYIAIKRNEFNKDAVKMHTIDDLFSRNVVQEYSNQDHDSFEDILNDDDFIEDENEVQEDIQVNEYSPENDINSDDLEDFTMGNSRNHAETKVTIQRLVRDSTIARKLKELYDHECQLCGYKLRKSDGSYMAEAHHIQPYNKVHRGDDTISNLLILCPNCHSQFDDLYFALHPETQQVHCIFEDEDPLHMSMPIFKHTLDVNYLNYAWNLFIAKKELQLNKI